MPFDLSSPVFVAKPETVAIAEHDAPEPSFMDALAASMRLENMIGSTFSQAKIAIANGDIQTPDKSYNVFQDDEFKGVVDQYPDKFDGVYNKNAARAMAQRIQQEEKDKETRLASGWSGVASDVIASGFDLPMLIPGGAMVRGGKIGYSVAKSAATIAAASGIATAVQEAGLQATQETRSATDTMLNIGGSVVLGGLLGAGASRYLSGQEWGSISKQIETDLSEAIPDAGEVTQTIVKRMQSAGAAAVDDIDLSDLGVGGPRAAQAVANATASLRINPGVQTMLSPSTETRKVYAQLVDNPIYTTMNMEGRTLGPQVENLVKQYERGAMGEWLESSRNLYREARRNGVTMTKQEFYDAVAKAGRRGDVDINGNSYVTKAAQEARAKVFNPLLERAKAIGLLPEDVQTTTAASYVTRFWNRQKLIGEEDRFRQIARRYFDEQLAKIPDGEGPDFINAADRGDYIDEAVTSVFNNLTGRGSGDVPEWLVPLKRGPLKERTFNIPDELIEDFLENDMEAILRKYSRTMAAEVELAQKFGRADMRDQLEAITKEYEALSMAAKTPQERIKLRKAHDRDIENLTAFRDLIRGTYKTGSESSEWSRITRAAMTWNYIRLLGGVTLSSLTDASRLVGVHGVRATMTEALPSLVKNVKAIQISKADAKALGAVTEKVLQSRLASMAELNDPYAYGSRFERFLSNTSNVFSKTTGLGYWNDAMKSMASVMTQNRMMRNALDWNGAGKTERAYMAMLGIDEDMAQRIAAQFKKYGMQEDGIYGANVRKWDDDLAARAWAAALNKDVDRTIITPSVADKPLWMRTNTGKLLMQFKSFGLAANQRVLISGLQERPHRLAEQMVFATSVGMLIGYLKYIERGDYDKANELLDNPGKWVADGLDRSGILFLPFEISNTLDKVSAGVGGRPIGISAAASFLAGDESQGGATSRYASRGPVGAVAGPSLGIFEDLATIATQLMAGDMKKTGVNAAIRQLPGATLPGIRSAIHIGIKPALTNAVED